MDIEKAREAARALLADTQKDHRVRLSRRTENTLLFVAEPQSDELQFGGTVFLVDTDTGQVTPTIMPMLTSMLGSMTVVEGDVDPKHPG